MKILGPYQRRIVRWGTDLTLLTGSVIFFLPGIRWIFKALTELYDTFNLVLLLIVLGLLIKKWSERGNLKGIATGFRFRWIPLFVVLPALAGYAFFHFVVDIHILSAGFFSMYLFGLAGFYFNSGAWKKSVAPFILLTMVLPFGTLMDIYVGFPMRLFSVNAVTAILSQAGIQNLTTDTIITIENSATQVDFSCSGLKGIWAALLLFFTITWLDNSRIGIKWILTLGTLMALVVFSNILRILTIVWLISVLKLPDVAHTIHAPLGIIGFSFSCAVIYFWMRSSWYQTSWFRWEYRRIFPRFSLNVNRRIPSLRTSIGTKLMLVLLLAVLGLAFHPTSDRETSSGDSNRSFHKFQTPKDWHLSSLNLREEEKRFFEQQGSSAIKCRFSFKTLHGSFLLVTSNNWRGHHDPEFCIRGGGNTIEHIQTKLIHKDLPIKWMQVNGESNACFWFLSPTGCTDDYSTRVWSEITHKEDQWILVSVIFNESGNQYSPDIKQFINQLNLLVQEQFTKPNN